MITCLYCGYECPDTAQFCPNCGKPLVRVAPDKPPAADTSNAAWQRQQAEGKPEQAPPSKQVILAASGILLLAFIIYQIFAG